MGDPKVHGITLTHADRVLFPGQGLTKRDLADYYAAIADRMLPHVVDRPLSLVRCPQGRDAKCFYQKHASAGFPDAIEQFDLTEATGETKPYMRVTGIGGLIGAVQMGALEFHIWGSRTDRLEKPDRMVFDLDPDEGLAFADVRSAAFAIRDRLSDMGLRTNPMVTGGKGVHVIAPLRRTAAWPQLKAFAKELAEQMSDDEPDRFTASMAKEKRAGRIFIDWLRNERGATAIVPWSTRARLGAPVALPVSWDELGTLERANGFTTLHARERLQDSEPWPEIPSQSITKALIEAVG